MGFYAHMSLAEKIAHLTDVASALQQSIYYSCALSGIDVETLDLEAPLSSGITVLNEDELTRPDWMSRRVIVREMEKLKMINKKLEELKNA